MLELIDSTRLVAILSFRTADKEKALHACVGGRLCKFKEIKCDFS